MDAVPRIALVMGDAAGVGIELAARLLAQEAELAEAAVLVVGDPALLARGAAEAGVALDVPVVREAAAARFAPGRIRSCSTLAMRRRRRSRRASRRLRAAASR